MSEYNKMEVYMLVFDAIIGLVSVERTEKLISGSKHLNKSQQSPLPCIHTETQ